MSAVSENIQTEIPAPLIFADSAAAKVADLIIKEGNHELKLRDFVQSAVAQAF
jgi:iron-sulfur cluster insertion protein